MGVTTAAAIANLIGFGTLYSFGVFFEPLAAEFDASRGALGWVLGIGTSTFLFLSMVSGWLADRIGPRPVVAAGGVLLGAGLLGAAHANALWQVYLGEGVLVGTGLAFVAVPTIAAVGRAVPARRRALAVGIAVTGSGAGTLLYAPVSRRLVDAFGWRDAMSILGVAGAASLLVCAAAIHARGDEAEHVASPPWRDAVRSRAFGLIWLSALMGGFAFIVPQAHVVPYARDHGATPIRAAFVLAALGGASTVGRFVVGLFAGSVGHRRAFAASQLGMAMSLAYWLVARSPSTILAFAIAYGFFQGAYITMFSTIAGDYFGTERMAGILGLLYTAGAIGELVGPPVAGALYDALGSYTVPIAAAAAADLVAFALLAALPDQAEWRMWRTSPSRTT